MKFPLISPDPFWAPVRPSSVVAKRGFTLLELLIVIAIIALLSVILILVLNPAEQLAKSRDAQRLSDLATLKTALGIFVTVKNNPTLDGGAAGTCLDSTPNTTAKIRYSFSEANATKACTTNLTPGADSTAGADFDSVTDFCVTNTTPTNVDNTGWVPVDFGSITGGSPVNALPLDPTNSMADATPDNLDLVYRYACQDAAAGSSPDVVFELNAVLESTAYTVDDNRMTKDGGDNASYYELGSSTKLLPTTTNF